MERGVFWFLFAVFAALLPARAEAASRVVNVAVGDTLKLKQDVTGAITNNILWKHNSDFAAEWLAVGAAVTSYGIFKGATTLKDNTELEVKNVTKAHSGAYTVEIDNIVQEQVYQVQVLSKVNKPGVWIEPRNCGGLGSENCTLRCEGATPEAGLTYTFFLGQVSLPSINMTLPITKTQVKDAKQFVCSVKNAVSEERSDPKDNPFSYPEPPPPPPPYWIIAVVLVLGLGGAGVSYWKRDEIKALFHKDGDDKGDPSTQPGPDAFPLNGDNGAAA